MMKFNELRIYTEFPTSLHESNEQFESNEKIVYRLDKSTYLHYSKLLLCYLCYKYIYE